MAPSEQEWEHKKQTIQQIYFTTPLPGLMRIMTSEHNFSASKSQYETKFKQWNIRKNLTSIEWHYVLHKKRKRDVSGKDSEVTLNGSSVPAKRIRKEEQRHPISYLNTDCFSCPDSFSSANAHIPTKKLWLSSANAMNMSISNNPSVQFIFDLFHSGDGTISLPVDRSEQKTILLQRLKVCMLERYEGDLEGQVTRLLGAPGADTILELSKFVIYFSSNSMLDLSRQKKALEWITRDQAKPLLLKIFETTSPSVQAGRALLDADNNRTLFAGRPGKLLHAAVTLGHTKLVQELTDEGVIQDIPVSIEASPVPVEADIRKTARILNWIEQTSGASTLQDAIQVRDTTKARRLIQAGARLDAPVKGYSGHRSLLQLTLSIEYFPTRLDVELVKTMVEYGADVNAPPGKDLENGTALQIAASRNNIELVKLLLDAGAEINASPGNSAHTTLQAAVHTVAEYRPFQATDCSIVRYLLSKGADVNAPAAKRFGRTALQVAVSARRPSLELVSLLLEGGADVNAPAGEKQGITALQGAAIQGHMWTVQTLLRQGADVNAPGSNEGGRTALEGAAEWGRLDTVQLLMNAGSSPSSFGSAAALAEKSGYFVVADRLGHVWSKVFLLHE